MEPSEPSSVFVVQHLHTHEHGEECIKMIGVYKNYEDAESAVLRLRLQPGFCELPEIRDGDGDGFYIDEYELGKDHWTEGYVTIPVPKANS